MHLLFTALDAVRSVLGRKAIVYADKRQRYRRKQKDENSTVYDNLVKIGSIHAARPQFQFAS